MPEVVPFNTPQEAALALIQDHAKTVYGVDDADPLKIVADIMLDPKSSKELRLKAATTALKYTRTELRSTHVDVSGRIDHEHSHAVERATEQLWTLMDQLQHQKAKQVSVVEEGEIVPETVN